MTIRSVRRGKRSWAHEELRKQAARITELELTQRRAGQLLEISRLLTRIPDLMATLPKVMEIVAETLPLRSAIVLRQALHRPVKFSWQPRRAEHADLIPAVAHAQAMYDYLLPACGPASEDRARGGRDASPAPSSLRRPQRAYIVLPLVAAEGESFGTLQVEGVRVFDEGDLRFVNGLVNQVSAAEDHRAAIHAIQTKAEALHREQRLLAEAGAIVTSCLEPRDAFAAVAHRVVPLFADLCIIDEVCEGRLRRTEVVFSDARKQQELGEQIKIFALPVGSISLQAQVLASGAPMLFSELGDPVTAGIAQSEVQAKLMRASGLTSMMVLPLCSTGSTFGALTLATADLCQRYSTHDLAVASEFARRVAEGMSKAAMYEQTKHAMQVRQDLLSVVSHDLKNPLNAILMSASLLLDRQSGEDRRKTSRRQLEVIRRSGLRMSRLVEDLLDTVTIENGKLSIERDVLEVGWIVREAIDAIQPMAAAKHLELRSEIAAEMPAIHADPARIQQVFSNLLGNAIKFSRDGGTVVLRARLSEGRPTFSVTDTGSGIAPGDLPHLFDRFWQASRTAKLGTGLGLFIVKGIVDAHGGEIWVSSEPGESTTFSFHLPAVHLPP